MVDKPQAEKLKLTQLGKNPGPVLLEAKKVTIPDSKRPALLLEFWFLLATGPLSMGPQKKTLLSPLCRNSPSKLESQPTSLQVVLGTESTTAC